MLVGNVFKYSMTRKIIKEKWKTVKNRPKHPRKMGAQPRGNPRSPWLQPVGEKVSAQKSLKERGIRLGQPKHCFENEV
jgi:hypothetical protein